MATVFRQFPVAQPPRFPLDRKGVNFYSALFFSALGAAVISGLMFFSSAHAAGNAEAGQNTWEYTCKHCHGTPQPGKSAAFSDFGMTANKLSVYATNPGAITKAANEGYTIPEGNTNNDHAPGASTNVPMGSWAGMAANRLGLGATPTQLAIDLSAYFATLFDAPDVPGISNVSAGNAWATVNFTAPRSDLPITGYTVTASPGGLTGAGTAGPITVRGLANGTAYTFRVSATSSAGAGKASSPSSSVTPVATASSIAPVNAVALPAPLPIGTVASTGVAAAGNTGKASSHATLKAPAMGVARAGNARVRVFFTAPADSASITGYTVTALSGGTATGITATGTKSPVTVTGLTNGTEYTFTVTSNSKAGASEASPPSNPATPLRMLGE